MNWEEKLKVIDPLGLAPFSKEIEPLMNPHPEKVYSGSIENDPMYKNYSRITRG